MLMPIFVRVFPWCRAMRSCTHLCKHCTLVPLAAPSGGLQNGSVCCSHSRRKPPPYCSEGSQIKSFDSSNIAGDA